MELFILKDKMFATLESGVELKADGELYQHILYCNTSDTVIYNVRKGITKSEIRSFLRKIEKYTSRSNIAIKFVTTGDVKIEPIKKDKRSS